MTDTMYVAQGDGVLKKMVPVSVDQNAITAKVQAQQIRDGEAFVNKLLQKQAAALGYDSIVSACSYAGYNNPYQKESEQFIAWRGAVWKTLYDFMEKVKAGQATYTGVDQLSSLIPAFSSYAIS